MFDQTSRTKVRRIPDRARYDEETVFSILDEAFVCHVGFAVEGKPAAEGLPEWPALGGDDRPVMVLDEDCALVDDPNQATRRFWLSESRNG